MRTVRAAFTAYGCRSSWSPFAFGILAVFLSMEIRYLDQFYCLDLFPVTGHLTRFKDFCPQSGLFKVKNSLKLWNRFYSFRLIYWYKTLGVSNSPTCSSGLRLSFRELREYSKLRQSFLKDHALLSFEMFF